MRSLLSISKPVPVQAPKAQDTVSHVLDRPCYLFTPVLLTPYNGELGWVQGGFCLLPYLSRVKPKAAKGNRRTRGRIRTQGRLSKPRLALLSSGHLCTSECLAGGCWSRPGWRCGFCARSRGKMGTLSRHTLRGTQVQAAR